ncbi:hypothetical protein ACP70R_022729 [Stipagrostis hirtigluma subsp. patula]
MAKSKLHLTVLGVSLVALLFLGGAVQDAAGAGAGDITYQAMNSDAVPGGPSLDRPDAIANTYTRGCEAQEACRGAR